jgi:hypothetical protein
VTDPDPICDAVDFDACTRKERGYADAGAGGPQSWREIRGEDRVHALELGEVGHMDADADDVAISCQRRWFLWRWAMTLTAGMGKDSAPDRRVLEVRVRMSAIGARL